MKSTLSSGCDTTTDHIVDTGCVSCCVVFRRRMFPSSTKVVRLQCWTSRVLTILFLDEKGRNEPRKTDQETEEEETTNGGRLSSASSPIDFE